MIIKIPLLCRSKKNSEQIIYNPRTKSQYKHTDNGQSKELISNNENNPKIKKLIED